MFVLYVGEAAYIEETFYIVFRRIIQTFHLHSVQKYYLCTEIICLIATREAGTFFFFFFLLVSHKDIILFAFSFELNFHDGFFVFPVLVCYF